MSKMKNDIATEKDYDKTISSLQKDIAKFRKCGDKKNEMKCYVSLELVRELKRNSIQ